MSYDIDITVHHPDGYSSRFEVGNITYNIRPMMVAASDVGFSDLHDMRCFEAAPILAHAWREMRRNPARYRRFEASNGWGTYDQFMPYLTRFYAMARLHPNGIIRVS